jgi:hypothetical protein
MLFLVSDKRSYMDLVFLVFIRYCYCYCYMFRLFILAIISHAIGSQKG